MKTASKVFYIIAIVLTSLTLIAAVICTITFYAATTETLAKANGFEGKSTEELASALAALRVVFTIWSVWYLITDILAIRGVKKLSDPEYFYGGKVGVPVLSIIFGLFNWVLLLAGIFWLVSPKKKQD